MTGAAEEIGIVTSPDDVTPEWLTSVLRRSGAASEKATITAITATRIGDGKIGCNARFSLEWDDAGDATGDSAGPATVVAKFPSDDPGSKTTGVSLGLYVREVGFYRELSEHVRSRVPACHLALIDDATGDFVLVLEDLAPAEVGDQLAGCDIERAREAVDELARLHASYWEQPVPDWVPLGMAQNASQVALLYGVLMPGFCEHYQGTLDGEVLDVVRAFAESFVEWGALAAQGPSTVVHGDYRLDNLLFGASDPEGGTPARRVAAVDWQTVGYGSPFADLAYFIGAGLVPEDRHAHEDELVERYLRKLAELGIELPDPAEIDRVYAAQTLGGLIMAVLPAMMVGEDERSKAMFATMAERHARHALERDALGIITANAATDDAANRT